jgi:hypothetical protein
VLGSNNLVTSGTTSSYSSNLRKLWENYFMIFVTCLLHNFFRIKKNKNLYLNTLYN